MPDFGFRTGTFHGWQVERTAAELARLGYDCLELCLEASDVRPEHLSQGRCGELRETFDRLGIELASVSYHADREPLAQRLSNQGRAIHVAHWLGAELLVINAEKTVDWERQWREHVAHLQGLCELAGKVGVTLAVEPEPLLVIGTSQEMLEMIDVVAAPNLKVNLDIGHAQVTDDDPAASIRQLGSAIAHLHLDDIKDRVHRHLPLGQGDIDFPAVRQALIEVDYLGPYVADLFGLEQGPSEVAADALAGLHRFFD